MPIETRNFTGIDSDAYDNRAPDRPHFNSTPFSPPKAAKFAFPPLWVLIVILIAVLPFVGVLAIWLWRLFEWIATTSEYASDYDVTLIMGLKIAFALATGGLMLAMLVSVVLAGMSRLTIRMQNNFPVSAFDVLFGGKAYRELLTAMQYEYYRERRTLWENSRFWALETLDQSVSNAERKNGDVIDVPVPVVPLLPETTGADPISATLVQRGLIARSGNSLLVGFSAEQKPHYIELPETGFIAVAGQPRTGKSATAAFLTSQIALIPNATIFVADKHARRYDSLTKRLEPLSDRIERVADTADDIARLIDDWFEIGRERLLRETNDLFPPVFIVIDEFTAMILLEDLPETTLKRMLSGSVEFPKVSVHGLYLAHQFTGRLLGGSLGAPLRRVTTQKIVMRIDPDDAKFLIPDQRLARTAGTLGDGRALFFGASQTTPVEIAIPEFTRADIAYVAGLLPAVQNTVEPVIVSGVSGVSSASQRAETNANGDHTNGAGADVDNDAFIKYNENTALHFLRQQYSNGAYKYTIRDVQAMTNLRTARIVALAHLIGRKRTNESDNE